VKEIHPSYFGYQPPNFAAVPWSLFINTIVWGYGGYDDVGNIAEELDNPQKQFPRAMVILIILSVVSYAFGLLAAVGLNNDYANWQDGTFSTVAGQLGGQGFQIFMTIGAMISSLGQFNALLCVSAQEFRALGKKDMLGIKALRWRHPKLRTPILAIVINTLLVAVFTKLNFGELVQLDNALYAVVMLMEYTALIRMRYTHKNMERPFRISRANAPTIALVIPAMIFCLYIIGATCFSSWLLAVLFIAVLLSGTAAYLCLYFGRIYLKSKSDKKF